MNAKTLILIVFILLAASTAAVAQSSARDEQTFKSIIKQMTDAQTNYDSAVLDKIFSSDYIEISPLGEFDPRDKVLGFYTPQAKIEAGKAKVSLEVSDYSIRSYDKLTVVIARFDYAIESEVKILPPRSMRVTLVFRKEKGAWKIASAQYTGIRAAAAKQSK